MMNISSAALLVAGLASICTEQQACFCSSRSQGPGSRGLGELYRDDPEFRTCGGQDAPGTAAFIAEEMAIFAQREL